MSYYGVAIAMWRRRKGGYNEDPTYPYGCLGLQTPAGVERQAFGSSATTKEQIRIQHKSKKIL